MANASIADRSASWPRPACYDFAETTRLLRTGGRDPTFRREAGGFWRAVRMPDGTATVHVTAARNERIDARAWGDGAGSALAAVPAWLGLDEPAWELPPHPVTDRLLRDHPGVRLANTGDVYDALLVTVLQQLVTWREAAASWRRLVREYGEPAPGPGGLRLPPAPRRLRSAGPDGLMALGLARQRAQTLYDVAFSAKRLQRAAELPTAAADELLRRVHGVGPWTAAMVLGLRLGRPEPIVLGDVHLPHAVCWALAGEARGGDARMTELLAPFDGQAFRVLRLIHAARIEAPRRGPRHEIRFDRRF